MEAAAAVLAVGDALQSHALLEAHYLRDRAILDCAQRDGVDLATMPLFTRRQQVVRTQEAADVVMVGRQPGAEADVGNGPGGFWHCGHLGPPHRRIGLQCSGS